MRMQGTGAYEASDVSDERLKKSSQGRVHLATLLIETPTNLACDDEHRTRDRNSRNERVKGERGGYTFHADSHWGLGGGVGARGQTKAAVTGVKLRHRTSRYEIKQGCASKLIRSDRVNSFALSHMLSKVGATELIFP